MKHLEHLKNKSLSPKLTFSTTVNSPLKLNNSLVQCSQIEPGCSVKKVGDHWFRARVTTPAQSKQSLSAFSALSLSRSPSFTSSCCVCDSVEPAPGDSPHLELWWTEWWPRAFAPGLRRHPLASHPEEATIRQRLWTSQSDTTTQQFVWAWTDVLHFRVPLQVQWWRKMIVVQMLFSLRVPVVFQNSQWTHTHTVFFTRAVQFKGLNSEVSARKQSFTTVWCSN